ncbi:hypothetical protein CUU62_10095 [Pseudomonas sp. WP001]|nr:hypothetical protein CUU62_10095 [Pseudomonas sp. WP001]
MARPCSSNPRSGKKPEHTPEPIVPTLCVGMPLVTLCVTLWTRSVLGCIPTQSVGTINRG